MRFEAVLGRRNPLVPFERSAESERVIVANFLCHDFNRAEIRGQQSHRLPHPKANDMAHRAAALMPLTEAAQMFSADTDTVGQSFDCPGPSEVCANLLP